MDLGHPSAARHQPRNVCRAEGRPAVQHVEVRRFEAIEDARAAEPGRAKLVAQPAVHGDRRAAGRRRTTRGFCVTADAIGPRHAGCEVLAQRASVSSAPCARISSPGR